MSHRAVIITKVAARRDGDHTYTARDNGRDSGKDDRVDLLWVGIGGTVGALGRYVIGGEITERASGTFPYGTFTVNMIGALLIGALFAVLTERGIGHDHLRFLLVVGLLGGFTTFSSYTLEAINLIESGHWPVALAYVAGSNVLGIAACFAGIASVRWAL